LFIYFSHFINEADIYEIFILFSAFNAFQKNYLNSKKVLSNYDNDEIYIRFWSFIFNIPECEIPKQVNNQNKVFIVSEKNHLLSLVNKLSSKFVYLDMRELKKHISLRNAEQLVPIKNKFFNSFDDLYKAAESIIGLRDAKYFRNELLKSIKSDLSYCRIRSMLFLIFTIG